MPPRNMGASHELLRRYLLEFAAIQEPDWLLAQAHWKPRTLSKDDFFNFRNSVCQYVGFVVKGLFRVYHTDLHTGQEQNMLFIQEGTFLASLKSMITQQACPYYIAALEESELLVIRVDQLQSLYAHSHGWERFGRLLAEHYLIFNQARAESMVFQSAEQRYQALLTQYPGITNRVSLGHIASYLGIKGPSLSRIRAQLDGKQRP